MQRYPMLPNIIYAKSLNNLNISPLNLNIEIAQNCFLCLTLTTIGIFTHAIFLAAQFW